MKECIGIQRRENLHESHDLIPRPLQRFITTKGSENTDFEDTASKMTKTKPEKAPNP